MKNQTLFVSKDKSKKLKCRLMQFLIGALRVNLHEVLFASLDEVVFDKGSTIKADLCYGGRQKEKKVEFLPLQVYSFTQTLLTLSLPKS